MMVMTNEALHEIEEELQWDRVWGWVCTYRYVLISSFMALMIGIAGFLWYDHKTTEKKRTWSTGYIKIVERAQSGDFDQALADLDILMLSGSKEQKALLSLLKARLILEQAVKAKQKVPPPLLQSLYTQIMEQNPQGLWAHIAQLSQVHVFFDSWGDKRPSLIHKISEAQSSLKALGFEAAIVDAYGRQEFKRVQDLCDLIRRDPQISSSLEQRALLVFNHVRDLIKK